MHKLRILGKAAKRVIIGVLLCLIAVLSVSCLPPFQFETINDTLDYNVSITSHGLVPKLPNDVTQFLNGVGGWSVPGGGGGNVSTLGGTIGRLAQFTGANTIGDATNTDAQVSGAVANSHAQNTDTILTTNGAIALINAGVLRYDLRTDRWLSHDTNTFLGVDVAGAGNLAHTGGSEGWGNSAFGYSALHDITTSYYNTAIGYYSLAGLTIGLYNTALGQGTLATVTTGSFNTAVGLQALNANNGSYNTAVGLFAGHTNAGGSNNVFIGAQAGKNEAGSNKLYIDSSDTATPLIGGDFSTDSVTINGTLSMATHRINNVTDPAGAQDAATKTYVDSANSGSIEFVIDGGGSEIADGEKGHLEIPFACTLTQWTLISDVVGDIKIDVWRDVYANFPPTNADSITNAHEPEITAGNQKAQDTDISDWTDVTIDAGDILAFNVDSATTITRVTLSIRFTRP